MKKRLYWKHISEGRLLLVALVIVGVALSGRYCNAAQDDSAEVARRLGYCVREERLRDLNLMQAFGLSDCSAPFGDAVANSNNNNNIGGKLTAEAVSACCESLTSGKVMDCVCRQLKELSPDKTAAVDKVCNGKVAEARQQCADKEKAVEAAAQREERLSKADPCDRFLERLAANEVSKFSLDDAKACQNKINTCAASCQKQ